MKSKKRDPDPNEPFRKRAGIRLAKAIAMAGYTSRRKAEQLITRGLVTVNGVVIQNPAVRVDPDRDRIDVAGHRLELNQPHIYVLVYKPRGVICSVRDPRGRKTVLDLIRFGSGTQKFQGVRLYPVGRLDYNSEGLVLLTNDGEMALRIMHPRYGCRKTYHVKVKGRPGKTVLSALRRGFFLDGRQRRFESVEILRYTRRNTWLEVVLGEGRKHQIRRMLQRVGHPVLKLIRVAIGPLVIGDLKPGQYRLLDPGEIKRLEASLKPSVAHSTHGSPKQ